MTALIAAFLLAHFDASEGWWWAYGIILTLGITSSVLKASRN
jgi:hypothetical protein